MDHRLDSTSGALGNEDKQLGLVKTAIQTSVGGCVESPTSVYKRLYISFGSTWHVLKAGLHTGGA